MKAIESIIDEFVARATRYVRDVKERKVFPSKNAIDGLRMLDIPLQENPIDPAQVLRLLDSIGAPATTACSGNRYFGFVTGGSLPASLGATLLAAVWDQNAVLEVSSPISSAIEKI
jgi:hypothetical protein